MNNKEALIMAEQQLLWFCHCRRENNLISLISCMGLKEEERKDLKKEYSLAYMNNMEKKEIDDYFTK